ncbi:hypothetical protein MLD38_016447 [Melastoma candidum]|uniref:Uncharacterized protein n=1 Tax=Melastoma candidum TaxID=119954 RepID=A0ACB9RJI0_9MYRT|nr:hypothetical protein MLD38_016447 [Melastoma candidum]
MSLEQNRQQKNKRRQMNYAALAQTFLADLSKEENQIAKLLACRALRLIVGRMEGPIKEINEVLTDLTLFARYNGNCEEFVRKGQGWWGKNEWDRHNAAAMERFKTQVEREAKLNWLSERIDILLLRIDSSRKGLSVQEKAELRKCFKMWKVAVNLKIQELNFQSQGWQRKLAKMEALASERMRPSYVNTDLRFVLQGTQDQADSTNQEEDIGMTTQVAGPLTFGDALELITSAIVDNSRRPRPPALTSPVIRRLMARLNQIDIKQSPLQRLKECRELRQLLGQLEGVPNYIGDLHEELYTLALLDAPDTSWQPNPVDNEELEEAQVADVEPAPLSLKEALELLTSAIIDSRRPRPPALTSSLVRKALVKLELIDQEENPMLRLKECWELRRMLHGIDGVPAHIGDLHEELYTLALIEVPDQNWLPDPVVPASPTSANSSATEDLWLDERDFYYPSTPEDEGSNGSDS